MGALDNVHDDADVARKQIDDILTNLGEVQKGARMWDFSEPKKLLKGLKGEAKKLRPLIDDIEVELNELVDARLIFSRVTDEQWADHRIADDLAGQVTEIHHNLKGLFTRFYQEYEHVGDRVIRLTMLISKYQKYLKYHMHLFHVIFKKERQIMMEIAEHINVLEEESGQSRSRIDVGENRKVEYSTAKLAEDAEAFDKDIEKAIQTLDNSKPLNKMRQKLKRGKALFESILENISKFQEIVEDDMDPTKKLKKAKRLHRIVRMKMGKLRRLAVMTNKKIDKWNLRFDAVLKYTLLLQTDIAGFQKQAKQVYDDMLDFMEDIEDLVALRQQHAQGRVARHRIDAVEAEIDAMEEDVRKARERFEGSEYAHIRI
ncbi:hypothetical protein ACFL0V_04400 [Nanoarchaeota archaeon]